MLRKRDKKILEGLALFRCMSRDQIAEIFFKNLKNPVTATNLVLKRLRRDGHIDANTDIQPYIYFLNPSTVKKDSQKLNHYLAIVDFYIQLCEFQVPTEFQVEKRYGNSFMQPDVFMEWNKKSFFVEIQRSRYTTDIMGEKIQRYLDYFNHRGWNSCSSNSNTPLIWIVSRSPYQLKVKNMNIIQTATVEEFVEHYNFKI
ncbi:replication-relaxation family protein [Priestia megaterium]|uniref:replication-relaxation family protein n=1 Tax=Priestia megaterium TaxID=1404 RepID=UPI0022B8C6C4|nr:replication-relaxation family protein [Priestia megaterium]MCZ8497512.1 replication-relaxation family protein [Priestia megaterium]